MDTSANDAINPSELLLHVTDVMVTEVFIHMNDYISTICVHDFLLLMLAQKLFPWPRASWT